MKLSIIILTYKSIELTKKCISSIETFYSHLNYEIILVNNDIEQLDKVNLLYSNSKKIKLINPGYNTYFAGGILLGLKYCVGNMVAIVNDDAFFIDDSLEKMFNFMNHNGKDYLAVTGNIYNDDPQKTLTITGSKLPTLISELCRITFISRLFKLIKLYPNFFRDFKYTNWNREFESKDVEVGCNAFMVFDKKLLEFDNPIDNNTRLYYTEESLGQLAKKYNKKIRYMHDVKIIHNWSYSSKNSPNKKILTIMLLDRFYYFRKYHGILGALFISILGVIGNPIVLINFFSIISWYFKLMYEKKLYINR